MAKKHGMLFAEVSAKSENVGKSISDLLLEIVRERVPPEDLRDVYMTLLLSLNEDFEDDDILLDPWKCW